MGHVVVVGAGATGAHAARTLLGRSDTEVTLVDLDDRRADRVARSLGAAVSVAPTLESAAARRDGSPDAVVLCVPAGLHGELAATALAQDADVVSIADSIEDVEALFALDGEARRRRRSVVVGAGFSPGLSCVLARHAAAAFDVVEEISVAKSGTGGPACARQHHQALVAVSWEWHDGQWIRRRGSSGRRLAWFPDLIGPLDCYRAALAEPFLLQRSFPDSRRLNARMAATRRDRLTGWLPMLRRPHADGGPGGLLVEVWGRRAGRTDCVVYGAADHPASVAAAVAGAAVQGLAAGWFPAPGVFGLAETYDTVALLAAVRRCGVEVATFEGAT